MNVFRQLIMQDVQVSDDTIRMQKKLVMGFLFPACIVMAAFTIAANFEYTARYISATVMAAVIVGLNALVAKLAKTLKFKGQPLPARNVVDSARWSVNFLVGAALVPALKIPLAPFIVFWTFLLMSAQLDAFNSKGRIFAISSGILSASALLSMHYQERDMWDRIYVMTGIVIIIACYHAIERFWLLALSDNDQSQKAAMALEMAAKSLAAEASLGAQSKALMHELKNMVAVMEAGLELEKPEASAAILKRSIEKIKQLQGIVLDSQLNQGKTREISVRQVFDDLETITAKLVQAKLIGWVAAADAEVAGMTFSEKSGFMYLIIQNIVKNACEAFDQAPKPSKSAKKNAPPRSIRVLARLHEGKIKITVTDNGPGMDQATIEAILSEKAVSSKISGHGLGLKFVIGESKKAGYQISIDSKRGAYTTFSILIPPTALKLQESA